MEESLSHRSRKADHIRINLEEDVSSPRLRTGFERYQFVHQALPETDMSTIHVETTFLGKALSAPLLISSMTGGVAEAALLNRNLALAAQQFGIAMGVGSQRVAIESEEAAYSFRVRDVAPSIFLAANLGAVQLNEGYDVDHCRRAVEMIGADALILHLNPLQEVMQVNGNRQWARLLPKIEAVCRALPVPVIAKEVGWGISPQTARLLANVGIQAIDVAGAGGTSWSEVERHRTDDPQLHRLADTFRDWGIPTALSLQWVHRALPEMPVVASGGIRNGLQVAKAIALGADLVGIASPFLSAAAKSAEAVSEEIQMLLMELRIAMFLSGATDLAVLRAPGRLLSWNEAWQGFERSGIE